MIIGYLPKSVKLTKMHHQTEWLPLAVCLVLMFMYTSSYVHVYLILIICLFRSVVAFKNYYVYGIILG